ncbi:CoA transferase [Thalassospira sp.]|uniref:CoA transferase n=1 Tax=Thalassospira sp. TaxID=1912094 RepID=UPI002732B904|nr:CoA transferase [Thalassospira sp.]MDP2698213.1 CoA transferase [Thalassospira sp.]
MTNPFIDPIADALARPKFTVTGTDELPSFFAVTDLAVATIGAAASMIARYRGLASGDVAPVTINRRQASKWFGMTIRPDGWKLPDQWDAIAGDYRTRDGWIRLHTNAPHHRAAALSVLGNYRDRQSLAPAVANWDADALEAAILAAGGCAATMRSLEDWQAHPQGKAVATEPMIDWQEHGNVTPDDRIISPERPLAGIRVLDLTRVLAGPVAGRFLAAYGADVLRIDPPAWDEGAVIPEVTLGKRCAGLDLKSAGDRTRFEGLLGQADILLHGYRPDALSGLGYDTKELRRINSSLIDVTLCAYGWTGPWAKRRGFDSLVQMSCGIADFGMKQTGAQKPVPLPVQALDHATGYLMAASAIYALLRRQQSGIVSTARHSLAGTAHLLCQTAQTACLTAFPEETATDIDAAIEITDWGPARRIAFPVHIEQVPQHWDHPAGKLRRHLPQW